MLLLFFINLIICQQTYNIYLVIESRSWNNSLTLYSDSQSYISYNLTTYEGFIITMCVTPTDIKYCTYNQSGIYLTLTNMLFNSPVLNFLIYNTDFYPTRVYGTINTTPITPSPTPEITQSPQPTPAITITPQPTPVNTVTPQPIPVNTVTPQPTPVNTVTPQPTPVNTVTPQPTPVNTVTPQPTPVNTVTPQPTPIAPQPTPVTPQPTPEITQSPQPTPVIPQPTPVTPQPTPATTITPQPTSVIPSSTVNPTDNNLFSSYNEILVLTIVGIFVSIILLLILIILCIITYKTCKTPNYNRLN